MSYLTIENFKYGRDSRRSELTTRPGALYRCQDAHINQGGEVELRLRFTQFAGAQTGPTFGFQEVADAVLMFASKPNLTVTIPTYPSVAAASGNIPAIAYRILADPVAGTDMTAVISSCCFDGKDFVIAEFAGGGTPKRYAFYNGVAIADTYRGVVLSPDLTTGSIAYTLSASMSNDLPSSLGFVITGSNAPLTTGTKVIHVTNVAPFTLTPSKTSAAGTLVASTISAVSPYQIDLTVDGTWANGDLYGCVITINGIAYNIGAGNLTGVAMNYCYTFGKRVWILSGTKALCSEINKPYSFNALNGIGNGFIDVASDVGTTDNLVSVCHYQGKLAFFSRRYVVIYDVPADPSQWRRAQVLINTGALAKNGVQPIGDLDVIYPSDTGVRSLRVRDASLNAFVSDIGSPVDALIQASLTAGSATSNAAGCAIVEPLSNRYWFHLNGVIFVFTYIPTEKITAWSTYTPSYQSANLNRINNNTGGDCVVYLSNRSATDITLADKSYAVATGATQDLDDTPYLYIIVYQGGVFLHRHTIADGFRGEYQINGGGTFVSNQTGFTPEKFVVFLGKVYIRDTAGAFYLVGSLTAAQYDNVPAIVETPWLAANTPGTRKSSVSFDIAAKNAWAYLAGMSPADGRLTPVGNVGSAATPSFLTDSTFEGPMIPYGNSGTHIKWRMQSGWASAGTYSVATISALLWHYETEDEKK